MTTVPNADSNKILIRNDDTGRKLFINTVSVISERQRMVKHDRRGSYRKFLDCLNRQCTARPRNAFVYQNILSILMNVHVRLKWVWECSSKCHLFSYLKWKIVVKKYLQALISSDFDWTHQNICNWWELWHNGYCTCSSHIELWCSHMMQVWVCKISWN